VAIVIPDMKKRDSLFQANTGVDLPLAADHRSRLPPYDAARRSWLFFEPKEISSQLLSGCRSNHRATSAIHEQTDRAKDNGRVR